MSILNCLVTVMKLRHKSLKAYRLQTHLFLFLWWLHVLLTLWYNYWTKGKRQKRYACKWKHKLLNMCLMVRFIAQKPIINGNFEALSVHMGKRLLFRSQHTRGKSENNSIMMEVHREKFWRCSRVFNHTYLKPYS